MPDTSQTEPVQLAVIIGSTRPGRFGDTVARWFADQARQRADVAVDLIDLIEADLPAAFASGPNASVAAFLGRVERAEAFVIVTPEYNHGYPASLKAALDLPRHEWRAKPVGFVSYGGVSGGIRAVEQLRQVFPELQAMTVRDGVTFQNVWSAFDEAGLPRDSERANRAANATIDSLVWWARPLRAARAADRAADAAA